MRREAPLGRGREANVRRGGERSTSDFGHDQFHCTYHQKLVVVCVCVCGVGWDLVGVIKVTHRQGWVTRFVLCLSLLVRVSVLFLSTTFLMVEGVWYGVVWWLSKAKG